jgi:hypothetical protein
VLGSSSLAAARDDAGDDLLAADTRGRAAMTARLSARTSAHTGAPLRVAIDAEHLHFFDPQTEAALV